MGNQWKASLVGATALGLMFLAVSASAQSPRSGHTNWGPWSFDWEVREAAGLNLLNVYYNDQKVLHKANVPVIRVQYDRGTVFADLIAWRHLQDISSSGSPKVRQRTYRHAGHQWLEIGVFAEIGGYRIYQVWYLTQDGYIHPRFWSRGWHYANTHRHHTYLRLDCDINGAGNDQIFVHDDGAPNQGWGPGWSKYSEEFEAVKNPSQNRLWFVRDSSSGDGLWVLPSSNDGTADSFAPNDAAGRRYHYSEVTGPHGNAWPWGGYGRLGYNDGENIAEQDVVFWYIHHINHVWEGSDESLPDSWHWSGPWLLVHQ